MSRLTILGGCGAVGSTAARALAAGGYFSELVIADKEEEAARRLAAELGDKVSAAAVDADDAGSLREVMSGSDVVLNCVGPFYRFGPPILRAAIEAGVNYVDICDDMDATQEMLAMDEQAKAAGVSALVGMGSSPGMANLLVKFTAQTLLDQVDSVDIYHAHGGEPVEGPAVIKHRFHSMEIDIPMFLDGEYRTVRLFEESGKALEEMTDFRDVGTYPVYAYPHPETITLPKYIKGVRRVTNLGLVIPVSYANLIKDMVRLGLTSDEPLEVQGQKVIPREFAVAFVLSRRDALLKEAGIDSPRGCLKIVVKGTKDGEPHTYIFQMSSRGMGMGEGTGIPAALGAIVMGQGKIAMKGVFPPEAAVDPMDMIKLAGELIKSSGKGDRAPIYIEHVDKDGKVETLDLKF
ncbi:saccharopine dehydrogenase NADP-binding domain-containing protein [Candidatus Solincola tengchongensis]|uniref:saccharopine dehydrogenase family protein n=1 Tax=Candidatus Solincola tengchongensis TaxID=2900693 RepID=UPI002580917A|nr:saccharopine dehydrogenase NADP-binding domain-containing protein [Candidatus Solincola tengchongensis]